MAIHCLQHLKAILQALESNLFLDLVIFFKSHLHISKDNSLRKILEKVNVKWNPEDVQISLR